LVKEGLCPIFNFVVLSDCIVRDEDGAGLLDYSVR